MPGTQVEIIRIRNSARYKRLQRIRKEQAINDLDPCSICGQEIDYKAEPRSPESWSMDHVVPLIVDITLAFDMDNLASSHYRCNSAKGGDPTWMQTEAAVVEATSIDW